MAATGKVLGTVTSVVGEAKATAADGTVRILQVGDVVHSDEVITTSAAGAVNIALESGKTLDCGANTTLSLHESILGVATATAASPAATGVPGTAAVPGSVEALQQAIASGQDPSQIAPATAAGGAPGAGGAGDGGGGTPVILEQANTSSVVTSGFPTAGDTITFPTPEFELLPAEEQPPELEIRVDVSIDVDDDTTFDPEHPEEGGVFAVSASGDAVSLVEGTMEGTMTIPFVITLSRAFESDVQVTYQIVPASADNPTDFFDGELIQTITIPAGESSFIVPIQVVRDHFVEGNESFSIVLIDAVNATINQAQSSAMVTIFNDDANPVANDDANWAQEDSNLVASGNVLQTASHSGAPSGSFADAADTDFEPLTVTNPGTYAGSFGTLVLGANGSYTYTLNNSSAAVQALDSGETLTESFGYSATDGFNTPDSATLTITIFGSNDTPTITVRTSSEIFASGAEGTVNEAALALGSNPSSSGEFVNGSFQVSDTDGVDDIDSVTINGQTVAVGSLAGATFAGSAGTMTVTSYSNGTANFTYELTEAVTDGAGAETDVFTLTTSDGTNTSAPATVTITIVDDVPTAVNDGTTTAEDTAVTVNVLTNDVGGADQGKTLLSATLATGGAGSLSFNANGNVTYTPAAGFEGAATINYTMRDADGDQSSASLVVAVGPDSVPQITAAADTLVDETGGLDSVNGALTATFGADVPGTIALSAAGATWNGSNTLTDNAGKWQIVVNGDGTYTATQLAVMSHPDASNPDDPIVVNVTATATDSEGDFTTDTFTVTIKDDGPVAAADTGSATEGLTSTVAALNGVLSNDAVGADAGGMVVGVAAGNTGANANTGVEQAIVGAHGTLTLHADGSYSYVASASANSGVQDVFTYTMKDADGDLSHATLTITFEGDRNVPSAQDDAKDILEAKLPGGSDAGADSNTVGGTVVFSVGLDNPGSIALDSTQGAYGSMSMDAQGNWVYTLAGPITDGEGAETDTFNYTVTDSDSSQAHGTIVINIVDDVPTAAADTGSATEGLTSTVAALNGVLSNDTVGADAGGMVVGVAAGNTGANANTGVEQAIVGAHGTLTLHADGSYSYVASASANSGVQDVFTYTMKDADGDLSHATLTITFEGDRNVPSAQDDAKDILEAKLPGGSDAGADSNTVGGTVVFSVGLDNPGSIALDSTQGAYGSMSMDAQGNWVYTLAGPITDGEGAETDTFNYTVTDSDSSQAHGTIVINIVDDVPTAAADTGSATEGLTSTVAALNGVLSNDTVGADAGGMVVGVAAGNTGANANTGVEQAIVGAHGTLTLHADGSYSYVASASANSGVQDVFTYTMKDADGDLSHATLTITFEGDRNVPSAQDDAKDILEAKLPGGSDAGADSNTVGGTVVFSVGLDNPGSIALDSTQGAYGSMSMDAQGNWVYTLAGPITDGEGAETDTFNYTVTDSDSSQAHGTIVINIVDDLPASAAPSGMIENDDGESLVGLIQYDMNADGLGTVTLTTPTVTSGGNPLVLTSHGSTIVYQVTDTDDDGMQELYARADTDNDGASDDLVFVLAPTTPGADEGGYTLMMHDVVDLPSLPNVFTIGGGIAAEGPTGQKVINPGEGSNAEFVVLATPLGGVEGRDGVVVVNSNTGELGISNTVMNFDSDPDDNEIIRLEFGTSTTETPEGGFEIVGPVVINDVNLNVFNVGGGSDAFTWRAFLNGVEVTSSDNQVSENLGSNEDTFAETITTPDGFDTLEITMTDGDFKIAGFTFTTPGEEQDVNLAIAFGGADSDGDPISGNFNVTITNGDGTAESTIIQQLLNQTA